MGRPSKVRKRNRKLAMSRQARTYEFNTDPSTKTAGSEISFSGFDSTVLVKGNPEVAGMINKVSAGTNFFRGMFSSTQTHQAAPVFLSLKNDEPQAKRRCLKWSMSMKKIVRTCEDEDETLAPCPEEEEPQNFEKYADEPNTSLPENPESRNVEELRQELEEVEARNELLREEVKRVEALKQEALNIKLQRAAEPPKPTRFSIIKISGRNTDGVVPGPKTKNNIATASEPVKPIMVWLSGVQCKTEPVKSRSTPDPLSLSRPKVKVQETPNHPNIGLNQCPVCKKNLYGTQQKFQQHVEGHNSSTPFSTSVGSMENSSDGSHSHTQAGVAVKLELETVGELSVEIPTREIDNHHSLQEDIKVGKTEKVTRELRSGLRSQAIETTPGPGLIIPSRVHSGPSTTKLFNRNHPSSANSQRPQTESDTTESLPLDPLTCSSCRGTFCNELALRRHEKQCKADPAKPSITCEHCPASFTQKWRYEQHLKSEHYQIYACPYCPKCFWKIAQLKAHISSHPVSNKKLECQNKLCGKVFRTDFERNEHMTECNVDLNFPQETIIGV